ncbi:MAG: hypothetical protein E7534_02070 [Ruminococcaceae bacterium]|nr:hypothetical protein [Oscillospiraceae bacterium]
MKKIFSWILALTLLMGFSAAQLTVSAQTPADLDLSALSELDENKTDAGENYAYTWTVEEVEGETVRTLTLTLDGAQIGTLTLPCRSYGKLHIVIKTEGDSSIVAIAESYVFNYSYQWNTITFGGGGALAVGEAQIQGGGNDHIIAVAEGATVAITSDVLYALNFGASGSNGSTLNVDGSLSVNGTVLCGQAVIGEAGKLTCKRLVLAGHGAFDTDGFKDAFVLKEGGIFEALGDSDWIDDATGEQYAALSVTLNPDNAATVAEIINIPADYMPDGYALFLLAENFATIDDGDETPQDGVIFAATTLTLRAPAVDTPDEPNEPNDPIEPDEPIEPNPPTGVDGPLWMFALVMMSAVGIVCARKKVSAT